LNENAGVGAKGRAGGSLTVTEERSSTAGLDPHPTAAAATANTNANRRTMPPHKRHLD